jgi:hypothetical protein
MILQTSTNVSGPFQDIGTPASGSRNFAFSDPIRFFRLRSPAKSQETLANF